MKGLSIEQKAKAYDKALGKAEDALNDGTISNNTIAYLQDIFPELKESEDEKIRKVLIRFHKSTIDIDGIKGNEIVSWLERQGEQNLIMAKSPQLGRQKSAFSYCQENCKGFQETGKCFADGDCKAKEKQNLLTRLSQSFLKASG